ncbi:hypothetical protein [Rhizobium sp. WYCCWR 11128]|nr:hypothetical protein [Rhizobium sp. WYCCWR 11128]NYT33582.1 hypothetical protein [Rhizobium sp. WYCCWR 11128]
MNRHVYVVTVEIEHAYVGMAAKGATVVGGDGEICALPFPAYFLGAKM